MSYALDKSFRDRYPAPAGDAARKDFDTVLAERRDRDDGFEEAAARDERQRLGDLIRHRRHDLEERTWHLRSLIGRFMQLSQQLTVLLGQAQAQTSGLMTALGYAQSLMRRAEQERGRAGSLDAMAQSLQSALQAACRETEKAARELHLNGRLRQVADMDLSAVQGQMQALEAIIQALLAEIAALLAQTRA